MVIIENVCVGDIIQVVRNDLFDSNTVIREVIVIGARIVVYKCILYNVGISQ